MIEAVKKDDELPEKERKLDGLLESVILFTKKADFDRVQEPIKLSIKSSYN